MSPHPGVVLDVDDHLDQVRAALRAPSSCGVAHVDRLVVDALRPGKLLRPALVVRSAATAAGDRPTGPDVEGRVVAGAVAVELLHVATLVHDDIIDAAALRRGRPSVVAAAGIGTALVVGDLLLARGVTAAAASAGPVAATWARALDCMAAGQLREAGLKVAPTAEALAEYASLKTAELFRASAEIGALAIGATPDVVRAHGVFGLHLGRAFQHLDDLLDTIGDPQRMGKPVGADVANAVPTVPGLSREQDAVDEVADLVGAELAAGRAALPAGSLAGLDLWATGALRRSLQGALADTHLDALDRLVPARVPAAASGDPR